MDQTAAVRVNARRAACQAAGSLHLESCQRCSRGGNSCSHLFSSSERLFPCTGKASPLHPVCVHSILSKQ